MTRDVPVREVMDRSFVAANPADDLLSTVELCCREEARPVVVLEGEELVGVLGDRDVLAALVAADGDVTGTAVRDAMSTSVPTVAPDVTLDEARDRMAAWTARSLVVTNGAGPEGVVTEHDVLAGSTIGSEADAAGDPTADAGMASAADPTPVREDATAADGTGEAARASTFEDQSICEKCGSLSRDLAAFNGQLLCPECRDV